MGTSLIRNTPLLGTFSRTAPRVLWWSYEGGRFLMSEVPLYSEEEEEEEEEGFFSLELIAIGVSDLGQVDALVDLGEMLPWMKFSG